MDLTLNPVEVRVLGSLMEKEAATPEYYPMTLNALRAACNQKTGRDPVMSLDEADIGETLRSLRLKGLAREVSGAGHRVHKFGHRLGEVFNFDRREQAVLCVLMLRGPQTVGEVRGRSERLYQFDDLTGVESTFTRLRERNPSLVVELPRRPGEKEPRIAHLFSGEVDVDAAAPVTAHAEPHETLRGRVERLEEDLAELRREFEDFRGKFE